MDSIGSHSMVVMSLITVAALAVLLGSLFASLGERRRAERVLSGRVREGAHEEEAGARARARQFRQMLCRSLL
jgi:hypothetical protein